jgi:hypothetical protein
MRMSMPKEGMLIDFNEVFRHEERDLQEVQPED